MLNSTGASTPTITVIGHSCGNLKRICSGVAAYLRKDSRWGISLSQGFASFHYQKKQDNIVAAIVVDRSDIDQKLLKSLNSSIPVVLIGDGCEIDEIPCLSIDENKLGQVASRCFASRGYHSVAFFGDFREINMRRRFKSFSEQMSSQNVYSKIFDCGRENYSAIGKHANLKNSFRDWISASTGSVGVFAGDDAAALRIYKIAMELGLKVPDDFALLGVNDDGLLCNLVSPKLASIRLPFEKMGYDAASRIAKLLTTDRTDGANMCKLYPPIGLIARDSIEPCATNDQIVNEALAYMETDRHRNSSIDRFIGVKGISLHKLDRHFRKTVGLSAKQKLQELQIEKARLILSNAKESFKCLEGSCQFLKNHDFKTAFKMEVGLGLRAFRKGVLPVSQSLLEKIAP